MTADRNTTRINKTFKAVQHNFLFNIQPIVKFPFECLLVFPGIGLSRDERMLIVIGEIIQELLVAHEKRKDVDLNRMKTRLSSKYGLESSPRLVDIIAAVPQEAKKILLPKLKAKPIRTASGVSLQPLNRIASFNNNSVH